MFKLTYDVEHCFEEHKLSIVLANFNAAQDFLLHGTRAKHLITAFDLVLLDVLGTGKNMKCTFFHKISRIEHHKLILFLILMISVEYEKILVFFCIYW